MDPDDAPLEAASVLSAAAPPPSRPGQAGGVALIPACAAGDADALQLYLGAGGSPIYANQHGITAAIALTFPPIMPTKPGMLRALLARGASATCTATFGQNAPDMTALHFAAGLGDTALAAVLIDDGAADVDAADAAGKTPLFVATMHRHEAVVDLLLSRGADATKATVDGADALMVLAEPPFGEVAGADTRLATALLAAGANLSLRDCNGFTHLHACARHGNAELVQVLLAAGAEVDARMDDEDEWTALMLAVAPSQAPRAHHHEVTVVRALVAAGASLALKDARGRDAYELCRDHKLRRVLKKLGGDDTAEAEERELDRLGEDMFTFITDD